MHSPVVCVRPELFQRTHIGRLRAFGALLDGKFDFLVGFEPFVAIHLNRREVDEDIFAAFMADEAVAFGGIEPLDRSDDAFLTYLLSPAWNFSPSTGGGKIIMPGGVVKKKRRRPIRT